ncbi:uncharacterized protein HD556DRAFT_22737 [Suillus plorans]|uniref:Uncharacterized protein n=1 Tax=Suillus plorans TaxID=116603 RepID=A0A9P7E323_9AGAM|nr:uncharacterized protein HD556DRAFT_22737 [Suillus plorans]KAG1810043.1 hypothetical protein HD556DRAFT_22737 [Suillus plorans]
MLRAGLLVLTFLLYQYVSYHWNLALSIFIPSKNTVINILCRCICPTEPISLTLVLRTSLTYVYDANTPNGHGEPSNNFGYY